MVTGAQQRLDPQRQLVAFRFGESAMMSAIFGHLLYVDPPTGELRPYFLESFEANDDFTVWTLTLHPNLKFSDGTDFDAESIKFALERAADPEVGSSLAVATTGLGLEVRDAQTLEVTLPAPNANFPASVLVSMSIGSPTAIQAADAAGEEFGLNPIGPGPFMITEFEPGQRMATARNPYFENFMPGQPYLDELIFENQNDQVQQLAALQSGSAQFSTASGGANVQGNLDNTNANVTYTGGGSAVFINMTIPPFDDVRARLAVAHAVDHVGFADAWAKGTPPVETLFPETSPFYNPEYTFPEYNPEEAQRLFDELAAEGKPVEFKYNTPDTAAQAVVVDYLIGQFAQYENVTFIPDVVSQTESSAARLAGEYQSLGTGIYFTNPIPLLIDSLHPDGTLNSFGWDNPAVRAAMDELAVSDDPGVQAEVWDVVQAEMQKDAPLWWVGQGILSFNWADGMVVPRTVNHGTNPLWAEVGHAVS